MVWNYSESVPYHLTCEYRMIVCANLRQDGKIECVRFHRGFFSESLKEVSADAILFWMDVDLRSSSVDVILEVSDLGA